MASTQEVVILAVDDKKQNLFALEKTLRRVPAKVVQATSGEEALALTLQHNFALAILDVQMPEMDGYELAEILLGDPATSRIPIIFVTAAYSDEQHLFKGYQSGAVDYIMKPFDPEVLLGKVRVFLELARYRLGLESLVEERTQALQASETKYRNLIENAYDMIQHVRPDGTFEFVSPSWKRVLGYSNTQLAEMTVWDILAPETQLHCREILRAVMAGRSVLNVKTVFLAQDGRRVVVEGNVIPNLVDGKVMGVQAFYRDVTAREEAETRLELAVKGSGVGLWDWRIPTGEIVVTGGWADVEGLPEVVPTRLPITAWLSRIHPEDSSRARKLMLRHFSGATDFYESELRMRSSYGDWIWVLDRGKVLEWDEQGQPLRAAGTYLDVTDRKRAEEERFLLQRSEAESRAKTDFLARMSHEIRTPMNAVLGYTQLLRRDSGLQRRQREYVETIDRSGGHLLALINQVLDLARMDSGNLPLEESELDLAELLLDIERMFRLSATSRGLSLALRVADDSPQRIRADAGKIRQVLINVLGNALKFTEQGGIELRVTAENLGNREVRIIAEVEDTGCGIEAHQQEAIFEAFGQTDAGKRQAGAGLGLAVSRQLARQMSGELSVTSVPGSGSVFRFDFVAGVANSGYQGARERKVVGVALGTPRKLCLVVAKQAESRTMLSTLLSAVGFEVREAGSTSQAKRALAAEKPDLVLFDLGLDSDEGFDLFGQLKGDGGMVGVAALLIGAGAGGAEAARALGDGADGFLLKPVREEQLLGEIARVLSIEYVWAGDDGVADPSAGHLRESLGRLSVEVREGLRKALESGHPEAIEENVARIASTDASLGAELQALASDYEYSTLLRLLGPCSPAKADPRG